MASGQVWIAPSVAEPFNRLVARLGGYFPILNVFGPERPKGVAALHRPTLYPELSVPADAQGDWGEVARGVAHLLSSLDGVPELRVAGTDIDRAIAQDINAELQIVGAVQEELQPKPRWIEGALNPLVASILTFDSNALPALRMFQLFRLVRTFRDGHPDGHSALARVRKELPSETAEAERIFNEVVSHDLRTAAGKARAALALLAAFQLDAARFFLQQSQFV